MPLKNKTKMIRERIAEYNSQVLECLRLFREAFREYIDGGDRAELGKADKLVDEAEGKADDIRREIEVVMYSEALFPESRGDIIGLLEAMDKIPNHAEEAVRMAYIQRIAIPEQFSSDFFHLIDTTVRCVDAMVDAASLLFENYVQSTVSVGRVEELESEADRIEIELITKIFDSALEATDKILLRDLVDYLSGIADKAEDVGDRIRLMVAKRSV